MRKKIIATVIAGAVLSTGILGVTACNSGNVNLTLNKGEEVTAEGWAKAFETIYDDENFSGESAGTSNVVVTGTSNEEKISYEMKLSLSGKTDYDEENDKLYYETVNSMSGTIEANGAKTTGSMDMKDKSYFELKEEKNGEKTYWNATYSYMESKSSGDEESRYLNERSWSARTESSIDPPENIVFPSAVYYSNVFYETKDATESTKLDKLYETFTYADGVYTANLWMKQDVEGLSFPELAIEGIVSISIKNEKIVGYQVSVDYKDTLEATAEEKEMGIDYSIEYHVVTKVTYNFSYGDTTVTAPKDAAKAIERAAEREKNNND